MTNETDEAFSPQERKIWFGVSTAEYIVIFIINAYTAFAFARNRHLRKRTTYLIINLTVADLLVGAPNGTFAHFVPGADRAWTWFQLARIILYNF